MAIARNPRLLPALAWWAITGQVILLASAWLPPLVSEYGLVDDTISELALGRLGAVQTAAFAIAGLGTLGLAMAIRWRTAGTPRVARRLPAGRRLWRRGGPLRDLPDGSGR
jgi:hypothetical protein